MKNNKQGFLKSMVTLFILITGILCSTTALSGEEFSPYALIIGGASNHNTGGQANPFIEANSMLGLRVFGGEKFLKGTPYWEAGYIFKNSTGGKAISLGGGIEWSLFSMSEVTFCGGIHAFSLAYENGKTGEWRHGPIISPYLCVRKGNWSLTAEQLVPNVLYWYVSYYFK